MIRKMFHDHPAAVGESYFEHMGVAFGFSARLFRAAAAAFLHGLVPSLCETTASSTIIDMHEEIRKRRAEMAKPRSISLASAKLN